MNQKSNNAAALAEPVPANTNQKLSVIADMASRFGMERAAFEATLKATVVPANISNEQFAAFLLVAKQYNLNPITKEIYAFPAKSGGIQPIVGIDGWCNIINSRPELNGIEFEDKLHDGKLIAITCRIHRKDRDKPTETTEYMEECKRDTQTWKQWPARMLRHKALIQCARYAFSFSGIVEQDEAERQDMIDVTPPVVDPGTGELIQPKASPFETAGARKKYCGDVKAAIDTADSVESLEIIRRLNKPKFDAMRVSRSEHDQLGLDDIELYFKMAEQRIEVADADAATRLAAMQEQLTERQ